MTTEAERTLAEAGPGGICEDCGHFAVRHVGSAACDFPYQDRVCKCKGMLWLGERVDMIKVMDAATIDEEITK